MTLSISQALSTLSQCIVSHISAFGYLGIFVGMLIESAGIPLPSEVILPFTGYLVWLKKLDLFYAVLYAAAGGTVGSAIAYYIGLYGGRPFLIKYGKYLRFSEKKFDRAEAWFARYGQKTVFLSRLLPVVRTFISIPAGIARIEIKKFLALTFVGSYLWCLVLVYFGYLLGAHWTRVQTVTHGFTVLIFGGGLLAIAVYYWYRGYRRSHRRRAEDGAAGEGGKRPGPE